MLCEGLASNVAVARGWAGWLLGSMDGSELYVAMAALVARVNSGDLTDVEGMLISQAVHLNAQFHVFVEARPHTNADASPGVRAANGLSCAESVPRYPREPTVFARQANIAQGPQQVNNASPARAAQLEGTPNKLLEAPHEERLDSETPSAAGQGDQAMAPVGAVDRTQDRGR